MTDRKDCRECTSGYRGHPMNRSYIRTSYREYGKTKKRWEPIGWFCTKCNRHVSDKEELK